MSKFNQLAWIGSILIGGITILLIVGVLSVVSRFKPAKVSKGPKTEIVETPCDTIKVEVIKEVSVPCTLPHIQPKKVVKNEPIDTSKSNI